ncbi:glycosyltransferase [Glutamicibacter sp. AOP33-2CA-4]|uniref:glycosyltransferase n=1 Tax=Glutamicibacter sp. AOP33-2CA-4 TaxID=3457690 RepID=UPI004034ED44
MKQADVNKRLNSIDARITEIRAEIDSNSQLSSYLNSKYYRDAVFGKHDSLIPAKKVETYIQRRNSLGIGNSFIEKYAEQAFELPNSNGQRWYTSSSKKIGILADQFLYKSFEGTAQFIRVTPDNYKNYLGEIDVLLVTSLWRGENEEWKGASNPTSAKRKLLENVIIPAYKEAGIPVIFYSKEDPPNYDLYVSLAGACDVIFTSAEEMIDAYKRDCPKAMHIGVLPFAVSHMHHNPVGSRRSRIKEILFAGSWHNHKYPERRVAAENIFDGIIESEMDLVIADRNYDLDNSRYLFPEKYIPYISSAIPHDLLLRIQKMSDVSVNLNSVIGSQTMYANRVVELQAMGSLVLSNYSAGVNSNFPNVLMPDSSADTVAMLQSLEGKHLYEIQMSGLRRVYSDHVNFMRMSSILETVGLDTVTESHRVAVLAKDKRFAESFTQMQKSNVELTIVNDLESEILVEADVILPIDPKFSYGSGYAQDLVNGFKYTDVDFVAKRGNQSGKCEEHEYTSLVEDSSLCAFWNSSETRQFLRDSDNPLSLAGYTADSLEVSKADTEFISLTAATSSPMLSVVIPTFNNGDFLLYKCFESLRRSSIFERMEIIIVDDGSTDGSTSLVVESIAKEYPNVVVLLNEPGGSGSASRPRNQGLELATAPWVTYLDPDNEALNDGYARLLEMADRVDAEFAIGNMTKNSDGRKVARNVQILEKHLIRENDSWIVPDDILTKIKFSPMSIQALVAKTSWLKSLGIEQPVGAVGQDSFFFQQMIHMASRVCLLDLPIHVYYAVVANSTVNSVGANFYRKYIPLEKKRSQWLREVGLLGSYNSSRLEPFVKGWYVEKLKRVAPSQLEECKQIIVQLTNFYGDIKWRDESLKTFFGRI